jgi:hypothetical protein
MDRGANGGIRQRRTRTHVHMREVDVTGIDNHELNAPQARRRSKIITRDRDWYLPTVCLPWTQLLYSFLRTILSLQEQG